MSNKKKNNNKKNNNQNLWRTLGGNLLIWGLIIIMAVTSLQYFSSDYKPTIVTYSQFQEYMERGIIESGRIIGRTFKGKLREPITIESDGIGEPKQYSNFTTVLPEVTLEMTRSWDKWGISLRVHCI